MNSVKDYLVKNIPLLDFINYLCFLGLSLTTLYTANTAAITKLRPIMGDYANLAPFAAIGIALFVMSIFDADLRKHFITACQVFTADDWKNTKASLKSIAFFFLFLAIARLVLSGGATFISSVFMADGIVEDGDTEGLESMLLEKEKTKQTLAIELNKQVADVRATAERNASNAVSNAVSAGPARWQKLYKERNGWFLKGGPDESGIKNREIVAYITAIRNAETEAQRIRNAAEKQAETIVATERNALQREQSDANFSTIVELKKKQVEKAESKEWLLKIGLWVADLVMAIFSVLSSIALAAILPHRPEYVLFREETSATAIIREFFLSLWRIVKSYGVSLVAWLDGKSEGVVDKIGATVTINGRTVAMQRRNVTATPGATNSAPPPAQAQNPPPVAPQNQVANGVSRDYNLVADELAKAKSNVRAYESKLSNGKGSEETNRRGLNKWMARADELERELQSINYN